METLDQLSSVQLRKIHSGKVRESFRLDEKRRLIVVTDRISAFDQVLMTPIACKGAILNRLSNFWFKKIKGILPNHFLEELDPQVTLVREVKPIKLEMVIRRYITGSLWRAYETGKREFSGVRLGDGLKKNQRLERPILTPTTKSEKDEEITPAEIIDKKITTPEIYKQMEQATLAIFELGSQILEKAGILLVDTKYEFGIADGVLVLMDEIHTPDSSRFWSAKEYEKNPATTDSLDKEFVRSWLIKNKKEGLYPTHLPADVIEGTQNRYLELYEAVTGEKFILPETQPMERIYKNLLSRDLIREGVISIIMGSAADEAHALKMRKVIESYGLKAELRVISAHKNGEEIVKLARDYNNSIEPMAVIAVAGRSNGLGGALAANLNLPVINCPPFEDKLDLLLNLNSSLMMPSQVPAATLIDPVLAAHMAIRCLNLRKLRNRLSLEISGMKQTLREDDEKMRNS